MDKRIICSITTEMVVPDNSLEAIELDDFLIDVTRPVLELHVNSIKQLELFSEESREFGQRYIEHDGPCTVMMEDSICEFFDIEALDDLTDALVRTKRTEYAHLFETPVPMRVMAGLDICFPVSLGFDEERETELRGRLHLAIADAVKTVGGTLDDFDQVRFMEVAPLVD